MKMRDLPDRGSIPLGAASATAGPPAPRDELDEAMRQRERLVTSTLRENNAKVIMTQAQIDAVKLEAEAVEAQERLDAARAERAARIEAMKAQSQPQPNGEANAVMALLAKMVDAAEERAARAEERAEKAAEAARAELAARMEAIEKRANQPAAPQRTEEEILTDLARKRDLYEGMFGRREPSNGMSFDQTMQKILADHESDRLHRRDMLEDKRLDNERREIDLHHLRETQRFDKLGNALPEVVDLARQAILGERNEVQQPPGTVGVECPQCGNNAFIRPEWGAVGGPGWQCPACRQVNPAPAAPGLPAGGQQQPQSAPPPAADPEPEPDDEEEGSVIQLGTSL